MKKIAFIMAALLMISLSGCAQKNQTQNQGKENKEMNKTLIVYFSATGTTKAAAQKLANSTMPTSMKSPQRCRTPMPISTGATKTHVPRWR